ncbi:hypothetical protein EYF80_025076 [Liparis tanakae]|uniref:Uncharacterized protein n=1 Tax=Liparis tanakae TaxID=230148 RepID=A0A4Z2HFP6_9TELE|nr:hypothetical protein EYF80_025076 [Liparis tanakae]
MEKACLSVAADVHWVTGKRKQVEDRRAERRDGTGQKNEAEDRLMVEGAVESKNKAQGLPPCSVRLH